MKQITVRCPDDVALAVKDRAARHDMSLNDYVVRALRKAVARPSMGEWLSELDGDEAVSWRGSSAELIREDRDERS